VKADRPFGGLGGKIRRFVIDAERHFITSLSAQA
jgi:hypothetical protein